MNENYLLHFSVRVILLILILFSLKSNLTYSVWTPVISVILQVREGVEA